TLAASVSSPPRRPSSAPPSSATCSGAPSTPCATRLSATSRASTWRRTARHAKPSARRRPADAHRFGGLRAPLAPSPMTIAPMNAGPTAAAARPTRWWLGMLERRAEKMREEYLDLSQPIAWSSEEERRAAIKFFNAAFRAEESGLRQAHELAGEVAAWDPDLARTLELYGNEEGWHRELLTEFLEHIGGEVLPMGRVTRTFYRLYARAERMETIVLTNLMFETIGATTYRLALRNVRHPAARSMLTILTRDESFHVPLNVHFLRHILERDPDARRRLRWIFLLLFTSLLALPLASRPKARAFDGIGTRQLARAYAEYLGRLFENEPDLGLRPPRLLLRLLGLTPQELRRTDELSVASAEAAERAADRSATVVTAL